MQTLTYTIQFNPETGSVRPFEVWVSIDGAAAKFCSSSATLAGAEKSRKGYAKPRLSLFNIVLPTFQKV